MFSTLMLAYFMRMSPKAMQKLAPHEHATAIRYTVVLLSIDREMPCVELRTTSISIDWSMLTKVVAKGPRRGVN